MEQWKDIPGYEGIYEASNLGRIRTAEGKTTYTEMRGIRHWKQRIMKQKYQARSSGKRDARVCLWKDGKGKTYLVSRLIAMAWCDGYDDGMTVNHIDGNPENNCANNLEWVTHSQNIKLGFETGLYSSMFKPVTIYHNGEPLDFKSIADASRFTGLSSQYISAKRLKGQPICWG